MGMKNRFQEAIQNVQRQRHLARRSVAMVLVLAMLTAMSVSWRLHQDGIALAADDTRYYCGKEEHKHTDDCYIEGTEPICGYEEGEIVEETMDSADGAGDGDSSAVDWDEAGSEPESEPATQEEPEPEVVLHHHTADCYEEEEVLTCGIESDHVHQDYCYDQETGELLCTEHEHTDDCYTLEKVLVCGQEEGEPEETVTVPLCTTWTKTARRRAILPRNRRPSPTRNPKKKPPNPKRTPRSTRAIPSTTTPPSAMARC